MTLGAPVPVLRSFCETEARDFYLRYLGFSISFEHRFAPDLPLYMGLRRDTCELHLSEHHGDGVPGIAVRIGTEEIDALAQDLRDRGHPRVKPGIHDQCWGDRELRINDPFGNRLIFWQPL